MTSDPNALKISKKAEEIDDVWIGAMVVQHDIENRSIASIYVADKLGDGGHEVPTADDVYSVDKNGTQKYSVDLFDAWARHSSGERFVSLNQGKDPYIYKDGVYVPYVEGWVNAVMKACNQNEGVTEHFTKETVARIGKNSEMDADVLETQDPNITLLGNCALNTLTGGCQEYDPEHITFSKLDVNHVPGAQCPTWAEFIEYTLPESERKNIQELFGYCLVKGYPYHAAWFLLGKGQNGKGVTMNILRAMLGKRNCSAVPLQEVSERFYSHDLYNKYANISGDTSARALCDASMYKMLTGGDEIRVEQKGKDAFDFRNHAKIISSMNDLMKSDDQSDGFFRRFILIPFAKQVTADRIREKEGFEKRIIDNEMSGVLNWAIEGLMRLRRQGGFTFQLDKSMDDLRHLWNSEADHVKAFMDACCELGPKRIVASEIFMLAYSMWHEDRYGTPPVEDQGMITKGKVQYGFGASPRKPLAGDRELWLTDSNYERESVRCYTGICLKNTSGHLDVDINYLSGHWDEICGGADSPKGLSTISDEDGNDIMMHATDPPGVHAPTGSEIMALINERVTAYGGNMSGHAMSVIEGWIEDRGYNIDDIQFCVKQYRAGHRIFIPQNGGNAA